MAECLSAEGFGKCREVAKLLLVIGIHPSVRWVCDEAGGKEIIDRACFSALRPSRDWLCWLKRRFCQGRHIGLLGNSGINGVRSGADLDAVHRCASCGPSVACVFQADVFV